MFKALAVHLNMFHVCYGSQVNMATTDIVVLTHLSKSPSRLQTSIWLSSQSKGVDALLFKLNYIVLYAYAFKNQGHKNSKLSITKSHMTCCVSWLKEHGNNLLSQYWHWMPHHVDAFMFLSTFLCSVKPEIWEFETPYRKIVKRFGYYSIVIITHIMPTRRLFLLT